MLRLRNRTRAASKVGYLVKAVRDGFEYAGPGDTPVGVVTKVVPAGMVCEIQTDGNALVYVGETVAAGAELRMPIEDSGGISGRAYNIGTEDIYVSIGVAITHGRGLIEVTLNIGSNAGSGGGVSDHLLLANIGVNTHAQIDTFIAAGAGSWDLHLGDTPPGGVFQETINSGDSLSFVGDGTYIQIQYDAPNNELEFAYVGPTDFYAGWDIWIDSVDTGSRVTSTMDVNFISGSYVTVTHNFVTGPPPHNDITVEANLAAFDARYATQAWVATNYYTQDYINSNFDNYASWGIVDGIYTRDVISADEISFTTTTPTYIQVQYSGYVGGVHTMEIDYVGPTTFYSGWDLLADAGSGFTRVGSEHDVDIAGGLNITTTYGFVSGSPAVHTVTVALDSTISLTSVTTTTGIYTNNIYERTSTNGVDIDGVIIKDNAIVVGGTASRSLPSYGIEFAGSASSMIFGVQDGSGRIQLKWNATTGTGETYLTSSENAFFWDINISSTPLWQMKYAAGGTAGNPITWSTILSLSSSGDLIAAGEVESYDTSDIRLKDQVEILDRVKVTNDLMALKTIRYRHIKKNKIELGLIAQEVEAAFHENVKEGMSGDLMIHYGKMIPPILAMNQYQEERIVSNAERIAKLTKKVKKQAERIAELERKQARR